MEEDVGYKPECPYCGKTKITRLLKVYGQRRIYHCRGRCDNFFFVMDDGVPGKMFDDMLVVPRDIPDELRYISSEVYICYGVGAYRAVVILVRHAIETLSIIRGIESGNLQSKIDKLFLKDETIRRAAHSLRNTGNNGAHRLDTVSQSEAENAMAVLFGILNLSEYLKP